MCNVQCKDLIFVGDGVLDVPQYSKFGNFSNILEI